MAWWVFGTLGCSIPNPAFDGETESSAQTEGSSGGDATNEGTLDGPSTSGDDDGTTGDVPAVCEVEPPRMSVRFEHPGSTCGLVDTGIAGGLFGHLTRVQSGQWEFRWCEEGVAVDCATCRAGSMSIAFTPTRIEPSELADGCVWIRYVEGISDAVACAPHLLEIENVELDRLVYAAGWSEINENASSLLPLSIQVGDMKIDCRCGERPEVSCCDGTRVDPGFYELVATPAGGSPVVVPVGDIPTEIVLSSGPGPGTYAMHNYLTWAPATCDQGVTVEWYMHLRP